MTLRAKSQSLGLAAIIAAGSLAVCGTALAAPGNGNGNANGFGNGNGNGSAANATPVTSTSSGNPHASGTTGNPHSGSTGNPHASGSTGNPHPSGSTGNPHTGGSSGNPHTGAPPYGGGASNHGGGSSNGSNGNHGQGNNGQGKTTICHATGSATNPYVEITIANPAVRAHARHQDGRDIIPAPPGGCPGVAALGAPGTTPAPGDAAIGTKGAFASGGGAAAAGEGSGVLGATTKGGSDAPADGPAADTAVSPKASGTLAFTGMAVAVLGSIGAVLLFGGWLVRALGLRRTTP